MTNTITHTAILLFSRSSEQEACAKTFLPTKRHSQNKRIAQNLIDHSIKQVKGTELPFFVWNDEMQDGSTFGEKLGNAVESVFQKGFQKIVIIGNDCISLTSQQIRSAAFSLESHDTVLAPTSKGGVYLIGLSKNTFDRKRFIDIRWQTSTTYDELLEWSNGQQVFTLPVKNDVNSYTELRQQLNFLLKNNPVRILVENMLAFSHANLFNTFSFLYHRQPEHSFGAKAPPSLFF